MSHFVSIVANLTFLEEQVAKLKNKLDSKTKERDIMTSIVIESEQILDFGKNAKSGLCIRF